MNILPSATSDFLLSRSIESLHQDMTEYVNEVEFWETELKFFYKLLKGKNSGVPVPDETLADLEKQLIILHNEVANELLRAVQLHQTNVQSVLVNKSTDEQALRTAHSLLVGRLSAAQSRIRDLKKKVFSFVLQH